MEIPALYRCFNQERLDDFDPNKEENKPIVKAQRILINQGYALWYDGPGRYVVEQMEQGLIGKVTSLVNHPANSVEEIIQLVNLKNEILRDCAFIDSITNAFDAEEKRKSKLAPKGTPTKEN